MILNMALSRVNQRVTLSGICLFIVGVVWSQTIHALEFDGVLNWNRRVALSTPVSGIVTQVNVQLGDKVNEGEALIQLDDQVLVANVDKAKANVIRLDRLYLEAQRELERNQELYDRTVLSNHELELAKIGYDDAAAQLAAAKAQLAAAQHQLKYSVVRAPFSGYVSNRNVEVGQTIVSSQQASTLVELVDALSMLAQGAVSFGKSQKIEKGQAASVYFGKTRYKAVVQSVGIEPLKNTTDQYRVTVTFATNGKKFRAGEKVKVSIP